MLHPAPLSDYASDLQELTGAVEGSSFSVIPAEQGVSKGHPGEAQIPETVIPAKAGIQAGWSGETPL